ncbi:MAG: hypothetical protein HY721_21060 [Planctomycetes bacterium]|nr:hypothetical protein [Planctomycetota bacterium]
MGASATIVLAVALSAPETDRSTGADSRRSWKSWIVVQGPGGASGGGPGGSVPPQTRLADLAAITVKDGQYAFQQDLVLGTIDGKQIVLNVRGGSGS